MRHSFVCGAGAAVAGAALIVGCGSGATSKAAAGSTAAPTSAVAPVTTAGTVVPTTVAPTTEAPATTAAPAPATTAPAATPVMSIQGAAGQTHGYVRPTAVYFSGDSTNIVVGLTWTAWGPAGAVGHGTWKEDSCQPSCAAGTITDVPATLTLGNVVGGHFTSMTERAGSLDRTYAYPSNWAQDAQ